MVPKDKHTGTSLVSTLAAITTSATVKMLGNYQKNTILHNFTKNY